MAKLGPKGQDEGQGEGTRRLKWQGGWGLKPENIWCLSVSCRGMHLKLTRAYLKVKCQWSVFTLRVKNKIKVLLYCLGIAANKGLLVRGFSRLVANPFIFNVLLGQNDVGHIPETSSPPS